MPPDHPRSRSGPLRFLTEDAGATAVEYAIVAGLLALLALGGVKVLTGATGDLLTGTNTSLDQAVDRLDP